MVGSRPDGVADAGVLLVNFVGGIADMRPFADVFGDGRTVEAWDRFFERLPDAKVDDERRDLIVTLADRGYSVGYSLGFPERCAEPGHEWLLANGFPEGPVLCRREGDRARAWRMKKQHCLKMAKRQGRPVLGFIDERQDIVNYLRKGDVRAHLFDDLLDVSLGELDRTLIGPAQQASTDDRSTRGMATDRALKAHISRAVLAVRDPDGWANLSSVCNWLVQHEVELASHYRPLGRFVLTCGLVEVEHRACKADSTIPYVRLER